MTREPPAPVARSRRVPDEQSAPRLFFTADTHFGDHRTINIQRRPFSSVAEMDAALIQRWNATVAPQDVVWHLGDVARRAADVPALLAQLNGTKHLLRGNNDPDATLAAAGWSSVGDYAELEVDGRRLVLCHSTLGSAGSGAAMALMKTRPRSGRRLHQGKPWPVSRYLK
jgi:calcineurin-like phosphoesterase family protein